MSLLVQIDKLVMLIESPVFTSESSSVSIPMVGWEADGRPPSATARTGQISVPAEMPLRFTHDLAAKLSVRLAASEVVGSLLLRLRADPAKVSCRPLHRGAELTSRTATGFSAAAATTRSKLGGKDEIKWTELLSRTFACPLHARVDAQTSGPSRRAMRKPGAN